MSKKITVDLLTRVEGHGAVQILEENGQITAQVQIFEGPRFYEYLVVGQNFYNIPRIVSRICGICYVSHRTASSKAIEDAFGVEIPPEIELLRKLANVGAYFESHGLHIYFLALPDYFGYPSLLDMAGDYPSLVDRGFKLKNGGVEIMKILTGKNFHGENLIPGGLAKLPTKEEIKKIKEINCGPVIFLANEFFDALPIKQIYKKKKLFFEKYVALSNDNKKVKFLHKKANNSLIKRIQNLNLISVGNTIEYPLVALKFLEAIAKKINKFDGGLLTFDYGNTTNENQNTLQSVKKHRYTNISSTPGHSDITSHINFKLFRKILKKNNLNVKKVTTQNEFLKKIGILERANILSEKMTFKAKANMFYRLKRLLNPKEMGNLFKVIFAQKKDGKFSLGF